MKRILLACSSGMSTSLLVTKMKEEAEKRGEEVEVWAVAQDKAEQQMAHADVLLVGPQMRFMKKKFTVKGGQLGVPVDVIDAVDYGRVDGTSVLEKALTLINEQQRALQEQGGEK